MSSFNNVSASLTAVSGGDDTCSEMLVEESLPGEDARMQLLLCSAPLPQLPAASCKELSLEFSNLIPSESPSAAESSRWVPPLHAAAASVSVTTSVAAAVEPADLAGSLPWSPLPPKSPPSRPPPSLP